MSELDFASGAATDDLRILDDENFNRWFPLTPYYSEHSARLIYSLNALPRLPKGFSCLSIGSWGAEAPYLTEVMGASRIACLQAPSTSRAAQERTKVTAPNGVSASIESIFVDAESDELPDILRDFDLVIAWEILEHLNVDPARMVWQAIRALRIGGVLSITTPNALWHCYTTAHLYGENALGLKLQHHKPYATHWRLYSPAEVRSLVEQMGCVSKVTTSFLNAKPFSLKSRFYLRALEYLRRKSGNGRCSIGQHVFLLALKERDSDAGVYRPLWLYPATEDTGGKSLYQVQVH